MLEEVLLPQLGQTMEEGTIEKWHKNEGDDVEQGEVLFEITTDKATLEVEAFASGKVKKILADEGETVPVNELVAIIGEPDDELPEDMDEYRAQVTEVEPMEAEISEEDEGESAGAGEQESATAVSGSTEKPADAGRIFISPRARKLAEEQKVPITVLNGTGPEGRIIERDVEAYVERRDETRYTPTALETALQREVDIVQLAEQVGDARITKEMVLDATPVTRTGMPQGGERVELSPMRQTIAERMTRSKQNVPHFYLVGQVNMRSAMKFREERNETGGAHLTVTDLLVRAAGVALGKHPRMNVRFDEDGIVYNAHANVGVAVAVDDGLFVPVIQNADQRSLVDISDDVKSMAESARQGSLPPEKYEGGSVTISNLGTYGVDYFMPIINEPESAILGVGQISEEVIAEDGAIRVEPIMKVSVSADHRAVDGALAADFFATFRDLLEDPAQL